MTLRTLNYTKRTKVSRSDVRVSLVRTNRGLEFDLDLQLDKYDLDPTALVFLEARSGLARLRFAYGTVAQLSAPSDRLLSSLVEEESVGFRLLVTAPRGAGRPGLLVAEADNLKPVMGDVIGSAGKSLLPVAADDSLGQRVWRLDFESGGPVLRINTLVGGKLWASTTDFRAAVLPACIKEILTRIVVTDMPDWPLDAPDSQDWRSLWMWWASEGLRPASVFSTELAIEEQLDWVDGVVDRFTRATRAATELSRVNEGAAWSD